MASFDWLNLAASGVQRGLRPASALKRFCTRLQWVSSALQTPLLGAHTCGPVRASVLTPQKTDCGGDNLIWTCHIQSIPKIKRNKNNYISFPNYKFSFFANNLARVRQAADRSNTPFTGSKMYLSIWASTFPSLPQLQHPKG